MQIKPLVTFSLVVFSIIFLALILGGYLAVKYPANIPPVQNLSAAISPATPSIASAFQIATTSKPAAINNNSITLADVAKHNSANDCWLAIRGKAYNITSYEGSHPGGRGVIINSCGTEVSGIFASIHSNFAWNLLGQYYVAPIN